jgi:hypothetical protein
MAAWFACDMDDGVLRTGVTRAELVEWWLGLCCAPKDQLRRHEYAPGNYEYSIHEPGTERTDSVAILTADCARRAGWDPDQVPLYPVPDSPYVRVDRTPVQDSLDQGSLDGGGGVVVALPTRTEETVASEDELVRELQAAHADQQRLEPELAAARQRRREAAAGLRNLGKPMSWIAAQIGVTQQAVDGFLKYKERKNRAS